MYYKAETIAYLDGKWIKASQAQASLYSQTLHYGNGVFEGIRSYTTESGPAIFKAKEHFDRLIHSASMMHIPFEYTSQELEEISYRLLELNGMADAYIRPVVFLEPQMTLKPVSQSYLFIAVWEWPRYLGDKQLKLMTSSFCRPHPKSCHVEAKVVGHYTNSILATTEAQTKGYDEALLLDADGFVAEGPGANIFFEKGGVLYTPSLGNILPGITRATIIELARQMEVEVREELFGIDDLYLADSAFFVGTAAEVIGIQSIDDKIFPLPWERSLGHKLYRQYSSLVHR